jgi:hypothetical protein
MSQLRARVAAPMRGRATMGVIRFRRRSATAWMHGRAMAMVMAAALALLPSMVTMLGRRWRRMA